MSGQTELELGWFIIGNDSMKHQNLLDSGLLGTHADDVIQKMMPFPKLGLASDVALTVVYVLLFIFGIIGNCSVCYILARKRYKCMHLDINVYHANLAVTDAIRLLLAVPTIIYNIWEPYPWKFGMSGCIVKMFFPELTSYASVLTITIFTIEQYIAICHPIKGQIISRKSCAKKLIFITWVIAFVCALPLTLHTRTFYYIWNPKTRQGVPESLICYIPPYWHQRMTIIFHISTVVFFVFPVSTIIVMYVLIGRRLKRTEARSKGSDSNRNLKSAATRARRAVNRMLFAVVLALTLCWMPYHVQRLLMLNLEMKSPEIREIYTHLFHASSVLYFMSSSINPILYNILSRRFKYAFKRTFCRCCVKFDTFHNFYTLKAIFINRTNERTEPQSGIRFVFQQKPKINSEVVHSGGRFSAPEVHPLHKTKKDMLPKSTGGASSSGSHPHSDGRLLCLCRHKSCANIRTRADSSCTYHNNISYHDMESLKRMYMFRNGINGRNDSFESVMGRHGAEEDISAHILSHAV